MEAWAMNCTRSEWDLLFGQPQVRLVHQRGGLQRMIGALAVQVKGGEPAEFVVDAGERVSGLPI